MDKINPFKKEIFLKTSVFICFLCLLASVLLLLQFQFNVYSSHFNAHEVTESTAVKRVLTLQLRSLCLAGRVLRIRPVGRGVRLLRLSSGVLKPSVLSH